MLHKTDELIQKLLKLYKKQPNKLPILNFSGIRPKGTPIQEGKTHTSDNPVPLLTETDLMEAGRAAPTS